MSEQIVTSGRESSNASVPAPAPAPTDDAAPLYDPAIVANARVLVVDDESLITDSLRHFFQLELGMDEVITFNASSQAAAWAEQNRVDMVITDFLMPGMDGLALLSHVKRRHPEATRILLTGYADKANAIRAINEVGLFQYIEKPWEGPRLATVVRAGLEHMALQRTLRAMIDKLSVEHEARAQIQRALLRAFA